MFKWDRVDSNAPSDRADFTKQWALKLVDPSLKQTKGKLKRNDGGMCCLGVASCEVANMPAVKTGDKARDALYVGDNIHTEDMPIELTRFLKMDNMGGLLTRACFTIRKKAEDSLGGRHSLADANDHDVSFLAIAKTITMYPTAFFRDLTPEEEAYILAVRPLLPTREKYRAQKKELKRAPGKDSGETEQA